MKLNPQQIAIIEAELYKEKIVYKDILHEITDHIATTLENEKNFEKTNFEIAFSQFRNSNEWVKLLTTIKQQQRQRKSEILKYAYKQFISFPGLILFALFFCGLYYGSKTIPDFMDYTDVFTLLMIILSIIAGHTFYRKNIVIKNLLEEFWLYYSIYRICLRLIDLNSGAWHLLSILLTSFCLLSFIFTYKANYHFKKQRYV